MSHAGDGLWTVAVYVGLCIVWPRMQPFKLLVIALTVSFLVEVSQLSDWAPLEAIRANSFGRLFLGSGFVPLDLLRYTFGGLIVFGVDYGLAFWIFSEPRSTTTLD